MSSEDWAAALLLEVKNWLAGLREHGLVPDAASARLDHELAACRGERLDIEDDPLLGALLAGPTAVGKSS